MSLADDLKKQTKNFRTKKIDYQVDTLGAGNKSTSAGYHSSAENTITMNYHEDDKWMLNWEKGDHDVILYHEQKHRSNANKGFRSKNINVSPEQYYKLCMADEISANMAALIYLREEYIKSGDINVFDKENKRYSFYKEAVQEGEINPLSSDPKEFEKDMSLIMNGTQEMWVKEFAGMYSENHIGSAEWYWTNGKGNFKENEAEYQKQLDIAYTIGGVNFKEYMQKDVEIPSMENRKNAEYLMREKQLQFNDNMSFEQYNNLLQHLHIASNIKAISDDYFAQMNVKSIDAMSSEQRKAYTKAMQESAGYSKEGLRKNKFVKRDVNMSLNKALGWIGERASVPSENEANYQAALKSLYNINGIDHYSLLNVDPQEKMPIEKTKRVKEFEEKSWFRRYFEKMGTWECHIVSKVSNLFTKKERETPEQEVVKQLLRVYRKKKNPTREDIANAKNKIAKKHLKIAKKHLKNYPKWSKDKRVSEIQYEEILDLDKPVITGLPIRQGKFEAVRRSKSTDFKTADEALRASKEASTPENLDRAAYLKSLSGRTQQDTTARVSPSFSQMRDSKSSMELMLLRRQMGR